MELKAWQQILNSWINIGFDPRLISLDNNCLGRYVKCQSLAESIRFYEDVLQYKLIEVTSSSDFKQARMEDRWGDIRYIREYGSFGRQDEDEQQDDDTRTTSTPKMDVHPKDKPISFQCYDIGQVMRRLEAHSIDYITDTVEEGGVTFDQLLFHDPDGYKIEMRSISPKRRGSSKTGGRGAGNLALTWGRACRNILTRTRPKQNNNGIEPCTVLNPSLVGF